MPVDRSRLPALGPERPLSFPQIRRQTMANGMALWSVEHRGPPVLIYLVFLPVGSAEDPPAAAGLTALTADLIDDGSGDRSALDVQEALSRIGGQLDIDVIPDATIVALTTLTKFRDEGAALLSEMFARPRFEPDEFSRVRDLRVTRLRQLTQVPSAVADRVFIETLYAGHPYGHLAVGRESSLTRLTVDDAVSCHRRCLLGTPGTLIVVGDASHDELVRTAGHAFGGVECDTSRPADNAGRLEDAPGVGHRLVLVDRPGAVQSELRIGQVGPPRSTPDYPALLVLNMLVGGQFVSRINLNLREDKGYTYGARSAFDWRVGRGPFLVSTSVQTAATDAAIREIIGELRSVCDERPPRDEEIDLARAALTRGFPRNFETAGQIARAASQLALYGLPDDYFSRFVPQVSAVGADDAVRAARAHLNPDRLLTVVVGDAARVRPGLEALGLGAPVEVSASFE